MLSTDFKPGSLALCKSIIRYYRDTKTFTTAGYIQPKTVMVVLHYEVSTTYSKFCVYVHENVWYFEISKSKTNEYIERF